MIELGSITGGSLRIAIAARVAIMQHGQCAVFLSNVTGEAAAVPYTDPAFDWLLRRHEQHLVGTYVDDVLEDVVQDRLRRAQLLREINDDLVEHIKPSRWWLLARVNQIRRAA